MSRVGAPRLRPRRPYVCVGCVGWLRGALVLAWGCSGCVGVASGRLGRFCVRLLGWLGGAVVLAWCWLWYGWGLCRDSVPTFLRVLGWLGLAWCWLGICGGNCYHRRCFAACRRRVGGLWSQNPPSACSERPASRARGGVYGRKTPRVVAWMGQRCVLFRWLCWSCSACLRVFVGVVWLVFVGGLGGIATIGAALRRVVGVSGLYGRKTPECLLKVQSISVEWG